MDQMHGAASVIVNDLGARYIEQVIAGRQGREQVRVQPTEPIAVSSDIASIKSEKRIL